MFIYVDVIACKKLLLEAVSQVKENQLTPIKFRHIREMFNTRVQQASLSNNNLITVALLNMLCVTLVLIVSTSVFDDLSLALFILAFMIREVIFTVVVFWEIAKVNELSIQLTEEIGHYRELSNDDTEKQMKLFMNAFSKPITFPLAGMVLTRKDIIFRLILWAIALLTGIIQQHV
jgi:hypothetical protein